MIDTHTHLYLPEYNIDGQTPDSFEGQIAAVDRAVDAGVSMMILPGVDIESISQINTLHRARPQSTAFAIGFHPTEIKEDAEDQWQTFATAIKQYANEIVAIGEVGIDLYWDKTFQTKQMEIFDRQVALAEELSLPVIIHSRDGLDQCLEVMKGHPGVQAVFHSFGGSIAEVEKIFSIGDYYFGINGIITFKNSTLRNVLPAIPRNRILSETDSPYLAPTPHRGKRNESALMTNIVSTIADSLSISFDEADILTSNNATQIFHRLCSHKTP